MLTSFQNQLATLFLDRFNNYLTDEVFAEHNGISVDFAKAMIAEGKYWHEFRVQMLKGCTQ